MTHVPVPDLPAADPVAESRLRDALDALGMSSDQVHVPRLLAYLHHLQHWNKAYNLTAIRDPEHMLVQHVFDSLAVLPTLRQLAEMRDACAFKIADVGSGAGLPGIIIAVCEPHWSVTCVDTVGKKTAFMRQAAGLLGLSNVQVAQGRIEAMASVQADVVISRAFASLVDFVRLAAHHCRPDGVMVAMKGQNPQSERADLEQHTDWHVGQITELKVPELDAQRCLVHLVPN
ncbi:16S rRNA (guanine(527)-N(7))-methyltransferase RsmG [Castellaniella sp.]|uniref:16S rRNA (guanine(527)-N(7))-methyltransferase RsmG n=1 Tax=Castellaniella sp. TaxID=1955812 RepID=UPI003565DE54